MTIMSLCYLQALHEAIKRLGIVHTDVISIIVAYCKRIHLTDSVKTTILCPEQQQAGQGIESIRVSTCDNELFVAAYDDELQNVNIVVFHYGSGRYLRCSQNLDVGWPPCIALNPSSKTMVTRVCGGPGVQIVSMIDFKSVSPLPVIRDVAVVGSIESCNATGLLYAIGSNLKQETNLYSAKDDEVKTHDIKQLYPALRRIKHIHLDQTSQRLLLQVEMSSSHWMTGFVILQMDASGKPSACMYIEPYTKNSVYVSQPLLLGNQIVMLADLQNWQHQQLHLTEIDDLDSQRRINLASDCGRHCMDLNFATGELLVVPRLLIGGRTTKVQVYD